MVHRVFKIRGVDEGQFAGHRIDREKRAVPATGDPEAHGSAKLIDRAAHADLRRVFRKFVIAQHEVDGPLAQVGDRDTE